MTMKDEQIFRKVQTAIAEALRVSPAEVQIDSVLAKELDATSLDFVDTVFRLETEFSVSFYEGGMLEKLAGVFGPGTLTSQGRLTELGAEVLRRRMPEIDPSRIEPGMPQNVEALYTPATWVRVVKELLDARPDTCTNCGSEDLTAMRPSVLLCGGCGAEISCPTQEELLVAWAQRTAESLKHA